MGIRFCVDRRGERDNIKIRKHNWKVPKEMEVQCQCQGRDLCLGARCSDLAQTQERERVDPTQAPQHWSFLAGLYLSRVLYDLSGLYGGERPGVANGGPCLS